jgi:riboflavin kinase/FMN adenylyltransferase
MLTSTPHKLRLFEALGVDGCLLLPFTPELAALPPRRFLERLLRAAPDWKLMSVGADWRFGCRGEGDIALLTEFGNRHGLEVVAVPPVSWRGQPVSSTRIREAIRAGSVGVAASLLGRPFSVLGTVVKGGGLARKLGFPTANVRPRNEVRPADGVYACWARLADGTLKPGVMNVGRRPTLQPVPFGAASVMEIHLIGYEGRLYGQTIEVFFIRRLRAEMRFPSVPDMAAQVRRDIRAARLRLKAGSSKKGL